MKFRIKEHRYANIIFQVDEKMKILWSEVQEVIKNITDDDIITEFLNQKRDAKSISEVINKLLKERFEEKGWESESYIFADPRFQTSHGKEKGLWRLDFAKDDISIEVAFNHRSDCSWNLIKPVLASELNHVKKAIQTKAGIIICATDQMKKAGGFDSAVGTFETYEGYLEPLGNVLTSPLLLVGLEKPETFKIEVVDKDNNKGKQGKIVLLNTGEVIEKKKD